MSKSLYTIHGSCVTRDAFNFGSLSKEDIYYYQARSSLAVKHLPPFTGKGGVSSDKGAFKLRMGVLDKSREKIPLGYPIIFDLIDERLALCSDVEGGNLYTHPPEIILGWFEEHLSFSRGRLDLFMGGLTYLKDYLGETPIILHRAYYATHLSSGELLGGQENILEMNNLLEDLHERFLSVFDHAHVIDVDRGLRLAKADHIWGLAPFHYVDEYYLEFQRTLVSLSM